MSEEPRDRAATAALMRRREPSADGTKDDAGERKPSNGEHGEGGETRASAKEIHANVKKTGEEELEQPAAALAWSALAAGLTIAFSFIAGAYLASLLGPDADPAHRHAAASVAYPLGFMFVVLARNQLFTEHTLQPLIPLFSDFTTHTLGRVMRLYGLVLLGNLAGALVIGLVLARTIMVKPELHPSLTELARSAMEGGAGVVFYKAIFAGWLIALMAWLVAATRSTYSQLFFIWITTAPISALGFRHSIAGSVEVLYLAARGGTGWMEAVDSFIVPAVLGNVLGGGVIVALLNHSQVVARQRSDREREAEELEYLPPRWGLHPDYRRTRYD